MKYNMDKLEQKLKKTLSFYLSSLIDDESRDFMIKLILRDVQSMEDKLEEKKETEVYSTEVYLDALKDVKYTVSKIDQLKRIKEASLKDLLEGQNFVWLMKKIIIEQNDRINSLEFKVARTRDEVED
jgi:hypothetical protein